MDHQYIICDNCGTRCKLDDKYCKVCSYTLSNCVGEPVIHGIEDEELKNFIQERSDYYLEKFAAQKGKWFVQFNFAALLFGPTWFFYRKMYKIAIAYAASLILLSSLLSVALPVIFKADVDRYYAAREAYSAYLRSGAERYIYKDPPYSTYMIGKHPDFEKVYEDLKVAQSKIRLLEVWIFVPVFVVNIVFRLFANAMYKNHIITNIRSKNRGVSIKSAIGGLVAVNLCSWTISSLLLLIPIVYRFSEAAANLIKWL